MNQAPSSEPSWIPIPTTIKKSRQTSGELLLHPCGMPGWHWTWTVASPFTSFLMCQGAWLGEGARFPEKGMAACNACHQGSEVRIWNTIHLRLGCGCQAPVHYTSSSGSRMVWGQPGHSHSPQPTCSASDPERSDPEPEPATATPAELLTRVSAHPQTNHCDVVA
jgi:hypothetical protein